MNGSRRTRWLALGIWLATLAMMVLTIVLSIGDETRANDLPIIIGFAVGMLAFGTIGAVIATQVAQDSFPTPSPSDSAAASRTRC